MVRKRTGLIRFTEPPKEPEKKKEEENKKSVKAKKSIKPKSKKTSVKEKKKEEEVYEVKLPIKEPIELPKIDFTNVPCVEPKMPTVTKKNGFCLGNGNSRIGLNLKELKYFGKLYACNAYYREPFSPEPDLLISVNKSMIEEVKENYTGRFAYLTHRATSCEKRIVIDGKHYKDCPGWASGPISAMLMCDLEDPDRVFLIGHDLYSKTGKVNNIYAGTKNYVDQNHVPIPHKNWVHQLSEVFEYNPEVKFYRVVKELDEVEEWNNIRNIKIITFEEMWKLLREEI